MKPLSTIQESEDTRLLIRYLLDELSEGEQERVEERYASDEAFYSRLLATEDELIDSYVLGDISRNDLARFEQVYMGNPHRRKKVESNRILLQAVDNMLSQPPFYRRVIASLRRSFHHQHVGLSYSFAALLLVAILTGLVCWLLWQRASLHHELDQAKSRFNEKEKQYEQLVTSLKQSSDRVQPSPVLDKQEVAKDDQKKKAAPSRNWSPIVAFALHREARTRGGAGGALKSLVIRRGALLVSLTVDVVPNDYPNYRVSLERPGGEESWSETVVPERPDFSTKKIVVNLPATVFQHRDYILKVTGGSDEILAFHHISVINQNLPHSEK